MHQSTREMQRMLCLCRHHTQSIGVGNERGQNGEVIATRTRTAPGHSLGDCPTQRWGAGCEQCKDQRPRDTGAHGPVLLSLGGWRQPHLPSAPCRWNKITPPPTVLLSSASLHAGWTKPSLAQSHTALLGCAWDVQKVVLSPGHVEVTKCFGARGD